jgi:hypothetical protein
VEKQLEKKIVQDQMVIWDSLRVGSWISWERAMYK